MKSCVCRTETGRRDEECVAGRSTARLNRLAPSDGALWSAHYPRWISPRTTGSGVTKKRKKLRERRFTANWTTPSSRLFVSLSQSASRKETEMIGVSVGFFCDCEARKTLGKQSQKIHETPKIKRKRLAASYVSAASSPSSASMTSLSPAMLRITCVGCAASGGAGVPAGFTHTDARSAAPTPPCGARETRKKSDKRRGGRVSGAFARDARTKRRDP